MAAASLRNQYARALDEALAASSSDEFVHSFNLPANAHAFLAEAHGQALTLLRTNIMAEIDSISQEFGVDAAMEELGSRMKQQPLLPDGSRCILPAPREATTAVLAETVIVKQRHKEALRQAMMQIDQENAELQRQYSEQVAVLQGTSNEIAKCMATLQQTAEECEQWRNECM